MNENTKPTGPYKAYDVMTNELLGGYDAPYLAHEAHQGRGIEVIYRPSKKKKAKKEFPYNG